MSFARLEAHKETSLSLSLSLSLCVSFVSWKQRIDAIYNKYRLKLLIYTAFVYFM